MGGQGSRTERLGPLHSDTDTTENITFLHMVPIFPDRQNSQTFPVLSSVILFLTKNLSNLANNTQIQIISEKKTQSGFRPIRCICVCVSIDTMLNFDGDVDADVKCEHSITTGQHKKMSIFLQRTTRSSSSAAAAANQSEVTCEICFLTLPSSVMTGLQCDHRFCTQCWTDYLTTKIMDEGMGQVSAVQMFH